MENNNKTGENSDGKIVAEYGKCHPDGCGNVIYDEVLDKKTVCVCTQDEAFLFLLEEMYHKYAWYQTGEYCEVFLSLIDRRRIRIQNDECSM